MDEFSAKKITKDIEFIKRSLANVDKTLALQHQSLETHIKRTDLLEQKLEPVEQHVEQMRGIAKFVTYLSILATIAAGVYSALQYLKG